MKNLKANLLLVEDNSFDASLLRELFFVNSEGIDMMWVKDGQQAVEYLNRKNHYSDIVRRPDVILLDLSLPKMNGYDVLKQIKATPELANIPVIILTTSHSQLDENKCISSGAKMFLSKPYSLLGYEEMCQNLVSEVFPTMMPKPN